MRLSMWLIHGPFTHYTCADLLVGTNNSVKKVPPQIPTAQAPALCTSVHIITLKNSTESLLLIPGLISLQLPMTFLWRQELRQGIVPVSNTLTRHDPATEMRGC